jgi:cytoskeleton protein RodZ
MQAPTPDGSPRRTLGQTFAVERERQGLSRADAAQRLHMSAYQIEALESGDYGRLPKGTFLRGFVRNYAKVLGLNADDVLPLLTEDAPRHGRPGIVVPTQNIRFDPLGERLQNPYVKASALAMVVVAIGFAAMYWFLFIKPSPPAAAAHKLAEPPRAEAPAPVPPPVVVAAAPASAPPEAEPVKAEPAKPEPPKADARKADAAKAAPAKAEPAPKAAPAKAAAADGNVLRFRFHGESWVEIRDSRGKILFSRLNPAGSETEVAGTPPFNVIVGNAPEVQLFYNDQEFDLEPHTKVAVARFTVE